jgi:tRNA-binding protein
MMNKDLKWKEFQRVDMRVGTVVKSEVFSEATKPALKIWVDFGEAVGTLKTSAQISEKYTPQTILNKQIIAVVNFPSKQIANIKSECLILGALDKEGVIVISPEAEVVNGTKIS